MGDRGGERVWVVVQIVVQGNSGRTATMKVVRWSIGTLCITSPCQAESPIVKGSMSYFCCPRWSSAILFPSLLLGHRMNLLGRQKKREKEGSEKERDSGAALKQTGWRGRCVNEWQRVFTAGRQLDNVSHHDTVGKESGTEPEKEIGAKKERGKFDSKNERGATLALNCLLPSHHSASKVFACYLWQKSHFCFNDFNAVTGLYAGDANTVKRSSNNPRWEVVSVKGTQSSQCPVPGLVQGLLSGIWTVSSHHDRQGSKSQPGHDSGIRSRTEYFKSEGQGCQRSPN